MISEVLGVMGNLLILKNFSEFIGSKIKDKTKTTLKEMMKETIDLSQELDEKKVSEIFILLNDRKYLKEMEEYIENLSSYELEEAIKKYIMDFSLKMNLKENTGIEFANLFFKVFSHYLQMENKEMYDKVILGQKIEELKNRINYETLEKVEDILKENTELPFEKLDLDFFDYEDEEFSRSLKEKIDNSEKVIYIEGNSKEETYYCVLSELKKIKNQNRKTYIITEKEEWNKCNGEIRDAILIPYFYSNEIFPIKDNINIFIFSKYEPCLKANKITLKRRLIKNLQEKLEKYYVGKENNYIYNLIKKTNGIFSNLKRAVLNAQFVPKWFDEINDLDFSIIEKTLFLGEWTEKDKENISSLIGMKYNDFIKEIQPLITLEDPFLIKIDKSNTEYKVANLEEAWSYLGERVTDIEWKKYEEKIIYILSDIDNLYKEELKVGLYYEMLGQRKFSQKLKGVLLQSLVLYKNIKINSGTINYYKIDDIIESIFNNIIESNIAPINKWAYISEHILIMCEIAPSIVMKKMENELKKSTGLIEIMKLGEQYNSFGNNYYIYFLWAIEYLLQYKETAIRAIKWLLSINDLDIKYSISNSPSGTLRHVFNTWHNEVFLTLNDKIKLAEYTIKNYKKGWEIIINELPKNGDVLVGELSKPIYSKYINDIPLINIKDISKKYLELCIKNMDVNQSIRLLDFIEHIYYLGLWQDTMILFEEVIQKWDDEKKENLKFKLRNIIFENRFFEWQKIPLKVVNDINDLHDKINFNNPIWNFAFLFKCGKAGFPLLNPTPFKDKENYYKNNEKEKMILVAREFQEFKNAGYDFAELLSMNVIENFHLFGQYVAEFYSENIYNEEICKKVLNTKNKEMILAYAERIYEISGNEELSKFVNLSIILKEERELITKIIAIQELNKVDSEKYLIIDILNENIQELYWRNNRIKYINNKETVKYIIENCIKYGNGNVFEYLVRGSEFVSEEECLEVLIQIMDKNNINIKNAPLINYYIEEAFNKVYKKIYENNENIAIYRKIAKIELYYREVLSWDKLKCFVYLLKKEPNYYAEMLNILYKHEGEKENLNNENQDLLEDIFSFYHKIEFCPCTHKTNDIDEDELKAWVKEFEKILINQKQKDLFGIMLGRLFAFSPQGTDELYPHESVRKIIEELEDSELEESYIITIFNKRGVYSPDAGITEMKLSKEYKKNAEGLRLFYPFTASIYDKISESYMLQSQEERRRAEHEF